MKREIIKVVELAHTEYQIAYYRAVWSIFINELLHLCKFPDIAGRDQVAAELKKMKLDFKELAMTIVTIKVNFEDERDVEELIEKSAYQDAIEIFLEKSEIFDLSKKFIDEQFSGKYETVGKTILRQNESKLQELIVKKSKNWALEPEERAFVAHCLEPERMKEFLF